MKLTKFGFSDPISSQIPYVGLPTTAIVPMNSADVSDTVPDGHWPKRGHSTSATKRHRFGFGGSLSAGRQVSPDGEASRVPQFQSPYFRLGYADTWLRSGPRERLTTQLKNPIGIAYAIYLYIDHRFFGNLLNGVLGRNFKASFFRKLRFSNTDRTAFDTVSISLSDTQQSFKRLVDEIETINLRRLRSLQPGTLPALPCKDQCLPAFSAGCVRRSRPRRHYEYRNPARFRDRDHNQYTARLRRIFLAHCLPTSLLYQP